MSVTRLRASPRHGGSGIFFSLSHQSLLLIRRGGVPSGAAGFILYWRGEVPMDTIVFRFLCIFLSLGFSAASYLGILVRGWIMTRNKKTDYFLLFRKATMIRTRDTIARKTADGDKGDFAGVGDGGTAHEFRSGGTSVGSSSAARVYAIPASSHLPSSRRALPLLNQATE